MPELVNRIYLKDISAIDLPNTSFHKVISDASRNLPSACKECKWHNVCRGGKVVNRYSKENGFSNPSVYCSALKSYYEMVFDFLISIGEEKLSIEDRLKVRA